MRDQIRCRRLSAGPTREVGGVGAAVASSDQVSIRNLKRLAGAGLVLAAVGAMSAQPALAGKTVEPFIPVQTSTVASNGDVNPYGVAFVPRGFPKGGKTESGDILVSNFNAAPPAGQGTGTTIVSVTPDGAQTTFFQGTAPLGLTTALNVLQNGVVIVGNVPASSMGTPEQGSLIVLDKNGNQLNGSPLVDSTFLNGPWDSTVTDDSQGGVSAIVFVSCVNNGTVTRLELTFSDGSVAIKSKVTIAKGYMHENNNTAFVLGPTGLAYDGKSGTLYVASTDDNAIYAVPNAAKATSPVVKGTIVFNDSTHLHGPLGLVLAPNGDLISSQGDAVNPDPNHQSEIVEFTKSGQFVTEFAVDSTIGAAFGIAVDVPRGGEADFAAVNDTLNTVIVYDLSDK
ncbi:MAG TPA: hypothetical protein VK673_12305 [Chthoniobacterales bacterium]|nr:hypothetical protein [Chthoniobacterales bacterium]